MCDSEHVAELQVEGSTTIMAFASVPIQYTLGDSKRVNAHLKCWRSQLRISNLMVSSCDLEPLYFFTVLNNAFTRDEIGKNLNQRILEPFVANKNITDNMVLNEVAI